MIGVFDYTVILTYLSAVSAGLGILASVSGGGHPYIGVFFLLFCGMCDAFDGKVARSKKNRTDYEKRFGIQIDSLSDILAFGVLPICIGTSMIRISPVFNEFMNGLSESRKEWIDMAALYSIMALYLLEGLIRLAHYNVTEEFRQNKTDAERKYYEGLPITSAAIIFPSILLLQYVSSMDITIAYFMAMCITGALFVSKIRIPKFSSKGILILVGIGMVEFIVLIIALVF